MVIPSVMKQSIQFVGNSTIGDLIASNMCKIYLLDDPETKLDSNIGNSVPVMQKEFPKICQTHFKVLNMFCEDEKKFICVECKYSSHENHKTVGNGSLADSLSSSVTLMENYVLHVTSQLQNGQQNLTQASLQVQKQISDIQSSLQTLLALLKDKMNQHNCFTSDTQLLHSVSEKQTLYVTMVAQLHQLVANARSFQQCGNIIDLYEAVCNMKKLQVDLHEMKTVQLNHPVIPISNVKGSRTILESVTFQPILSDFSIDSHWANKALNTALFVAGAKNPLATSENSVVFSCIDLFKVQTITSGNNSILALTFDGTVYGRGTNNHGELALGHTNTQSEWIEVAEFSSPVKSIQSGFAHSMFSTLNEVYTCGRNDCGQLVLQQ